MKTLPKVYGISSLSRLRSGYKNQAVRIEATITRVTSAIAIRGSAHAGIIQKPLCYSEKR
jgi:hypothetical protein